MCDNCNKEKLKYIFYDSNNSSFFDEKGQIINNINNYTNEFKFANKKRNPNTNFELTKEQNAEIKKILRKVYKKSPIINFKYYHSDLISLKIIRDYALFGITEFDFVDRYSKKYRETLMLYLDTNNKCKVIKLTKDGKAEALSEFFNSLFFLQKTYDYYKILNIKM